jgi:hypothetical protein
VAHGKDTKLVYMKNNQWMNTKIAGLCFTSLLYVLQTKGEKISLHSAPGS